MFLANQFGRSLWIECPVLCKKMAFPGVLVIFHATARVCQQRSPPVSS